MERCLRGRVLRATPKDLLVALDYKTAQRLPSEPLDAEREDSDVTFERGMVALKALDADPKLAATKALWFGGQPPRFAELPRLEFRDLDLNDAQQHAVTQAMAAKDVVLIHGPPGTGKTRVLVEVVRQALRKRMRILVTAASHIAVDNLARRLAAHGLHVLRLGKKDRIASDLQCHSLDEKRDQLAESKQAAALYAEAEAVQSGKGRRHKDPRKHAATLRREAATLRRLARAKVMRRARVVCCTAAGVDAVPLGDEAFDLVVLDEATQAPDPVAVAALVRAKVAVLAGDPQQLPPTVLSADKEVREGLLSTLFERGCAGFGPEALCFLPVQHRMSAALMRFPSTMHYQGRLRAASGNQEHSLQDLFSDTELPPGCARPWRVIDTSELGFCEIRKAGSESIENRVHQQLICTELEGLMALGLRPQDVAVIATYAAQASALKEQLGALLDAGLEVGTVDGFQGREKEVVLVDLVRSNAEGKLGFLRDTRRINVALTRAKRQIVVVLHQKTLEHDAYFHQLLKAAADDDCLEQASGSAS